jgi:hypothetical protein
VQWFSGMPRMTIRKIIGVLAALVLPLAAVVAGGIQTAAPAAAAPVARAPWHNPNPSIAVTPTGNQFVFWKGRNGRLWEAYKNRGGSWRGPISITKMGILGSTPSAAINLHTYDQDVVWQGRDGELWFGCWNGKRWYGPTNLHMGHIGSRPAIASDGQGHLSVVWEGTNRALWTANYSPDSGSCSAAASGRWSGPKSLGDRPLNSPPTATLANGPLDVAWTGTAPQYDIWYNTGGTLVHIGMGPLDSAPSLLSALSDGYAQAFWAGTNGGLWFGQWRWLALTHTLSKDGPGQITQSNGRGMGPLGSAPSAAFATPSYYVVWQGQDNNLWEATLNLATGKNTLTKVPGMGPL